MSKLNSACFVIGFTCS